MLMTPEEFIKNNPFPKNGAEINNRLVREIQDPTKAKYYSQNLERLLKNNARLIYVIYMQYNYNQSLGSIMGFVFEGLKKATDTYDFAIGMPFYHYAIQTTRGLLQNYYNYNEDLVHTPVMKKYKVDKKTNKGKGIKHEYSDINDYVEHQHLLEDETDSLSTEINMIIGEYEKTNLSEQAKEELNILKLYRESTQNDTTLKDLSEKTKINTVKLRKIIDKTALKLRKFNLTLHKRMVKNEHKEKKA